MACFNQHGLHVYLWLPIVVAIVIAKFPVELNSFSALEMTIEILQLSHLISCYNCRYYKQEIIQLTDEIDNIHKNIKEKIDAEVQASDVMDTVERDGNRPLGGTADSLARRDRSVVRI